MSVNPRFVVPGSCFIGFLRGILLLTREFYLKGDEQMKDFEKKIRFIELRAWGESYGAIAEQLGVSKQTLSKWASLASTQGRIAELEVLEADALRDAYKISFRARIELLCQTLRAANEELARRNAEKHAKMSTSALLKLITSCSEQITEATTFPTVLDDDDLDDEWEAKEGENVETEEFEETRVTEESQETRESEELEEAQDTDKADLSETGKDGYYEAVSPHFSPNFVAKPRRVRQTNVLAQ